jgi:hypothetical protein
MIYALKIKFWAISFIIKKHIWLFLLLSFCLGIVITLLFTIK